MTQIIKFLLSGGFAALMNIASRTLFSEYFSFVTAVTLAFFVGLCSAFFLMKKFVFTTAQIFSTVQFIRFLFVNLVTLLLTIFISVVVANALISLSFSIGSAELAGHVFGVTVPVVSSFFAHKHFSFR